MDKVENWSRPYFKESLYSPNIFFVIYGDFNVDFKIPSGKYRVTGMPDGIDLMNYGPDKHPEVVRSFNEGNFWKELNVTNKGFADAIKDSKECYIFKGETSDKDDLDYFRNIIGICTYLLDNGGIGIYDPFQLKYWTKNEWINEIFINDRPNPFKHVIIVKSESEDGTSWFHTRGLLKYGRPDLSLNKVPANLEDSVIDLFNRFIQFQAFGGIITKGQEIKVDGLPSGMKSSGLKGKFDDPDFNNKHIEIKW